MNAKNPKCGAKTRGGSPCKFPAGHGTSHVGTGRCRRHGGASPQAEVAGAVELARRESVVMGKPIAVEPHEAIIQCIQIAAGEVQYATDRIAELQEEDAAAPVVTRHTRPRKYFGGAEVAEDSDDGDETPEDERTGWVTEVKHGAPALNVWIKARHEAMDRLVHYSAVALKAGVDERAVKLAEGMAQQLAEGMRAFALEMGFDPSDPKVRRGLRAGLEAIDGSAVEITREAA